MPATQATFSIRPLVAQDLEAWLALRNRYFPWPVSSAQFLFDQSLRAADEPVLELGAWTDDGALVGTAECYLGEEGERYIDRAESFIVVMPDHRRQGLGSMLADRIEVFARGQKLRWLEALSYQRNLDAAQPLLERRGFRELERFQESWQQPAAVALDRLADLRAALRRSGIETSDFASIDSAPMRQALYRCAMQIQRDMPHEAHAQWEDSPFGSWIRKVLEGPGASADSMFVASNGDQVVGLTYLLRRTDDQAEVGDTGVVRTQRRRGIARVLKMMATQWAAEQGIRRVQTDNRADNAGMLAINRQLGFVPGDQIVIFEKTLAP